ncbi:GatB/YqeY domain-containing protein [Candidatus Berkelbacteria bacterium]|nr:GatB/YqeY domain-containing protein [Candidatus Berkelbacteria bacterium]
MNTLQTIEHDLIQALKAHDERVLSTLRLVKSAITNKAKEGGGEVTEEQVLQVLKQEAKKRGEAANLYGEAGNTEQATNEKQELELIKKYLPAELPDEAIQKVIDEVKATGETNFGKLMGQVMGRLKGQADGSRVSVLVKKSLS